VELSENYVLIDEARAHPHRLLAKFSSAATLAKAVAVLSENRFEPFRTPLNRGSVVVLETGAEEAGVRGEPLTPEVAQRRGVALLERMKALKESGQFQYVEPDYVVTTQALPGDEKFNVLWGLKNTGQTGGVSGEDIDAVRAWDITKGSPNVTVAVIDSGIRYTHQDLKNQMWTNPGEIPGNGIDDDGNGYVDDVYGINVLTGSGNPMDDNNHGTHCAGTIGAEANGGGGHVGVAWQVKLMALKFLGANGSGSTADAIECIEYATSQNVRILSNSWGGGGASDSLKNAIQEAGEKGALFVAAAGNNKANSDRSPSYPASYGLDNILSVAAIASSGSLASFSNYGAATVHVAAPGVGIYSSTATSDTSYANFSGTSMATPHVAGVAALVVARYPGTDLTSLRNRVLQGAVPTAALAGKVITGGRVNAYNALTLLPDGLFEVNAVAINKPVVGGEATVFEVSVSDLDKVTAASVTAANTARGINATLRDDGQEPDRVAGDGVYTASIILPASDGNGALNSIDLVFSVTKSGKTPYQQSRTFPYVDPLTNDNFADARTITGTAYTSPAIKNTYATVEAGEPKHEFGGGGKSVWWRWTAPRSGRVQVDTRASSFDTVLAVYTGSALNNLALVASNDDIELLTGTYTSLLNFDAVAGITYWIAVDGVYWASAGRTTSGTILLSLLLNSQPVASDAEFTVVEGTPSNLSLSATDADGQELRFAISVPPAHGRAGNPSAVDGVFAYTSKPGFRGQDTLRFTATDGIETSAPAQVRITVLAAADADGDGLPDAWESAYGLNPALNDAALDADGDGVSNLQEYLGESNPRDPASRPAVNPIVTPIEAKVPLKGTANWGVCLGGNSMRNGLSSQKGPSSPQLAWSAGASYINVGLVHSAIEGNVVVTTPLLDDGDGIFAYSLNTGAFLWKRILPVDSVNFNSVRSLVAGICNGIVYAARKAPHTAADGWGSAYLYALNATTGEILWRSSETFFSANDWQCMTFAPNGDPIIWGFGFGTVRISARDGSTVWRNPAFSGSVVVGDRVYGLGFLKKDPKIPGSRGGLGLTGCNLASGETFKERLEIPPFVNATDSNQMSLFADTDGTIYVPINRAGGKFNRLYSVEHTGSGLRIKWSVRIAENVFQMSSFAIGPDRTVYALSPDRGIIRIDPKSGEILHASDSFPQLSREGALQMAIDANGLLFATSRSGLYSFNSDLTSRWFAPISGIGNCGPRLGDNGTLVVVGSGVGGVKAFRTASLSQNAKPEARGQNVSLLEDGSQAVVLAGTDADGRVASYAVVTGPSKGTLGGTVPNLVYTPGADFNGTDSFTFTVTDNGGAVSDAATVTLSVGAVNDAPRFTKGADQTVAFNSGPKTVVGWATGVSAGAPDESGQTLNFIVANSDNSLFSVQPAVSADGTLSLAPASGKSGSATVTVRLRDSGGTANGGADTSAAQTFTVTVAGNVKPEAKGQTVSLLEDGSRAVVLAGTDADGSVASYSVVTGPSKGTLRGTAPNLVYTPGADFNGTDSFTFTVTDNGGAVSDAATVTLSVGAVNDAPRFTKGADQSVGFNSGARTVVGWATGVSAGAPDESGQTLNFIVANSDNSLFSVQPAVSADGTLSLAPASGKSGSATVTVRLRDSGGTANGGADTSAAQTFTVTVAGNVKPEAKGQTVSLLEDGSQAVVLAGTDADGSVVSYAVVTGPSKGTLGGTAPNLVYTPGADSNGTDSFTFTVTDNGGAVSDAGTVTLSVGAVNDAPRFTKGADQSLGFNSGARTVVGWATGVSAGAPDESGQTLNFIVANSNNSLFAVQPAVSADGTLRFTPASGKSGSATVTVSLKDSGGASHGGADTSAAQTFTVSVEDTTSLAYSSGVYPCVKGPVEVVVPITVRRSLVAPQNAVSAVVTAASDTLQPGDYQLPASPMVLNWAAGDTSDRTFPIIFHLRRTIAGGGESLRLTLQNLVGAYVAESGIAVVALTRRDPGVLNFASTVLERARPESGDLTVNIPVRRVQGGTGAVSADVVVAGGVARAEDFTISNPVRLEWADGETADKTFAVVFRGGATVPAAEKTIQFRLANLSGGALAGGMSSTTLVVYDANAPGTLNFSSETYAAVKANTGDTLLPVSVNRGSGGNGAVSVQVEVTGGTASADLDYELPSNPVLLSWADDEMGPKTFQVRLKETAQIASGGETLLLKLHTVGGGAQLGEVGACTVTFTASDTAAPVLVLESPGNRATVIGESVLFKGLATDASGVSRVEVALNSEKPQEAVLMPSENGNTFGWMTTLVPEQGVNTVQVRAFDGRGNTSAMLTRQFTFLYSRPALTGTFDGRLQAAPEVASLAAEQSEEVVLQFVQTRGEGLLTASVTATGAFTGRLTTGGTTVPFKGVLGRDGVAWFNSKTDLLEVANKSGSERVVLGSLALRMQETGGLPRLVGELVSETATFGTVSAEKFVYSAARTLPAGRERVPVKILDPASENGRYTALFAARVDKGLETNRGLERTQFPQASGHAKVTVASSGVVSLAGRLADGTPVSYSNRLSPGGAVPVYVPLYAGRGFLAGTPVFDASQPETDLAVAQMSWVRPSGLVAAPYAAGWPEGITVDLLGSKYVPVTRPTPAVPVPANPYTVFGPKLPVTALVLDEVPDFVGVRLGITGGGLAAATTDEGQLSPLNVFKVTSPGAAYLRLVFAMGDGGFRGSFMHPVTNGMQPFSGVVLQKTKRAGGGFVFQPESGATIPAAVGSVEVTVP
jgi:subtilisin family serine protease